MPEFISIKDPKPKKPPIISRRTFLKGAGATVVVAAAGVGGPSAVDKVKDTLFAEKLAGQIKEKVDFIKSKYGIRVPSNPQHKMFT